MLSKIALVEISQEEGVEDVSEFIDDDGEEDKPEDRDSTHYLVGRKIKGNYTNGWFVGNVEYFNRVMNRIIVKYSGNTVDYISEDEIDGLDLILLPE